ncbi:MAG: sulfatase-like hydrolase/transferase [Deltaproteobacteria bacterium]|nr:sulfatase-like hydrolase/transferase [Deltaproteobacteria bacterium]
MIRTKTILAQAAVLFACSTCIVAAAEPTTADRSKPNVVLIMADDLGYECISANGCEDYETPHIDKLAADGMRFEQCFANPLCTPSRVKIMTGQYNVRNYTKFGQLDRSQKTFAHQLKKAGYATAIAGKWQLDNQPDAGKYFGFDEACLWQHTRPRHKKGTKFDSRFPNPQLEINGKPVDYNNGEYGPDVCADFICDFIETNKDKPFLAYYPMLLTHCPFDATPDSDDWDPKSPGSETYKGPGGYDLQKKHFRDMVQYTDKLVGKIVAKLEELGIRDNTMVIFTGDNGTDKPIKTKWSGREIIGGKGQVAETGTRVPLVVNWPGVISPKLESKELVEFSDIMPTFCDVTGAPLPENYPGDGVSLWPVLSGKGERVKKHVYVWYNGQTWARNVDYGVLNKGKRYTYQKFNGHFEKQNLTLDSLPEREQTELAKLKNVIDDLAKAPNIRGNNKKKGAAKLVWSKIKTGDVYESSSAPAIVKKAFKISGEMEVAAEAKQVVLAHGGTAVGYSLYLDGGELVFAVATGKNHLERVKAPAPGGKFGFAAGMDEKGHLFVQIGNNEAVRSQTGGHWITKRAAEDLSVGFDHGNPVDPKAPKGEFRGKLVKLEVK